MDPEAISKIFGEAIFKGFSQSIWVVFKAMWWLIPLALIFRWINKKSDKWRRGGRNRKFRGFSG